MGKDFLDGYILLAEGEKDPRNLLLAFAIARVLLIEFEIAAHVEVGVCMRLLAFNLLQYLCPRIYSISPSATSRSRSGRHPTTHMASHLRT